MGEKMKKNEREESLGTRLKGYEKKFESKIDAKSYLVCRIDGHKFSKYTKGMKKPFDVILANSMVETTKALVKKFGAVTGYVQSDEITLIFVPQFKTKQINSMIDCDGYESTKSTIVNEQIFGGRIQKMVSLIASFTTMTFNKIITDLCLAEMDKLMDKKESEYTHDELVKMLSDKCGRAWFDARIYGVESKEEAFNSLMWRVRDCVKNSQSMFAQTYCSHKSLLNKTGPEQINFCKETTGNDWDKIDDGYKYGFIVKKDLYEKEVDSHNINGSSDRNTIIRNRIVIWSEKLTTFNPEKVEMIVRKIKNKSIE